MKTKKFDVSKYLDSPEAIKKPNNHAAPQGAVHYP